MANSASDQLYEYLSTVKRPGLWLLKVFCMYTVAAALSVAIVLFIARK